MRSKDRRARAVAVSLACIAFVLCACSRAALNPNPSGFAPIDQRAASADAAKVYQPLAVGDSWTFRCNNVFTIVDRVMEKVRVHGRTVYALSLQIPSSPQKSIRELQLLANDAKGNTFIYGYLVHGKVRTVKPAEIVAAKPVLNKHYDYPTAHRRSVSRIFVGFEYTNHTPLGTFWVAPYFESGSTHNYGYSLGRGVMEEDHGPNFKYDCLITKYVLH